MIRTWIDFLNANKSPLGGLSHALAFGAMAAIDINNPVPAAVINGKINASEVRNGFLISNNIAMKKKLVANVVEE